jgi:hypothetical protein
MHGEGRSGVFDCDPNHQEAARWSPATVSGVVGASDTRKVSDTDGGGQWGGASECWSVCIHLWLPGVTSND